MLVNISPKLPMRDRKITENYYVNKLGFNYVGSDDFDFYLIVEKDDIQIHFFEFTTFNPHENYGQVYIKTDDIEALYQSMHDNKIEIHPNGHLKVTAWGTKEFALLDPDFNLLTFGQALR